MNLYWKIKFILPSLVLLGFNINPISKPIESINSSLKDSDNEIKKAHIKSLYLNTFQSVSSELSPELSHQLGNHLLSSTNNSNIVSISIPIFTNDDTSFRQINNNNNLNSIFGAFLLFSFLISYLFCTSKSFKFFHKFNKLLNFWNWQIIQSSLYQSLSKANFLLFSNNIFQKRHFMFFTQIKHYSFV